MRISGSREGRTQAGRMGLDIRTRLESGMDRDSPESTEDRRKRPKKARAKNLRCVVAMGAVSEGDRSPIMEIRYGPAQIQ